MGEPDFETPEHVIAAAHDAARAGLTRYTAPDGADWIKEAVRHKLLRDNRLDYAVSEIGVASGCKQVIFNALAATVDAGDEVVIVAPYWVSYVDMVEFFGGRPVIVGTSSGRGYLPDPEQLAAAMGPRTRWVLINSPNNPTGSVYPAGLLAQIARLVADHPEALLLSDEIYEQLVFDGRKHVSVLNAAPEARERVLLVGGVSKTYAMTGWRSGFGAGPQWLIRAMAKVQSQSAGSSNTVGQAAAAAALTGNQDLVVDRCATMQARRDLVVSLLESTDRLSVWRPQGTFYVYAGVSRCIGAAAADGRRLQDDRAVAEYLLDVARVATVPGEAFGASPAVRLSFALDEARIAEACRRIVTACNALVGP